MIVSREIPPPNLAFDCDAALVLCGPKDGSIPAFKSTIFTHLETVLLDAALCGFVVLINNFLLFLSPLVLSIYSFKVLTIHTLSSLVYFCLI